MSTKNPPQRIVIHWVTLKGMVALLIFLVIAVLIESLVVLYAINLGIKDETLLQWSFKFPGTDWNLTLSISPLFHLLPIAVVITLASSWVYLTKHLATKHGSVTSPGKEQGTKKLFGKTKSDLSKTEGTGYLGRKIRFARATIRSALTVLIVFSAFILTISLLAYPQLIFQTITGAYQSNPSLLGFIKGTGEAAASVGSVFSSVNDALIAVAPGFRDFVLNIGGFIKPLVDMDGTAKYLVFQNIAAWLSSAIALFYGKYGRKNYLFKKK